MLEKVAAIERRYEELNDLMAAGAAMTDSTRLTELAREQSELEEIVGVYRAYRAAETELAGAQLMVETETDAELAEMAQAEVARLESEQATRLARLQQLLLPKDPHDDRNVIVEIRAGAGGDEAGLFAADLFRMYLRWADGHSFKTDLMSQSETGIGGFKEVIFQVKGRGAFSRLKYESGVHRVQRVPTTEAQGRIHTSTATVAVLPEADEVDVEIGPNDVRIDVFRATGPGGQSVNTTDSAVRATHLPSGIVVSCQDEKSQLQNRIKAMAILRARLYQMEQERLASERSEARRSQVGSGERSEKIRTYNFPQNRVTDHRIGKTIYNLPGVLSGELDEFIEELATTEQAERLQAMEGGE
ncbi:MAG: peptide chain release factor 1 [Chloroflexota bacterium]|nr:peptide chain release factor 1 [Chloroflexota bacterium]